MNSYILHLLHERNLQIDKLHPPELYLYLPSFSQAVLTTFKCSSLITVFNQINMLMIF